MNTKYTPDIVIFSREIYVCLSTTRWQSIILPCSETKEKNPNLLLHRTPIVKLRYVIKLQNDAKKIVTLMWWHIGHVYSINSNESRERSFWSSLPKRTNKNTACNQRLLFICTHKYNFSFYIPNTRSKGKRSKFLFVGKRTKEGGRVQSFSGWTDRLGAEIQMRTQMQDTVVVCLFFFVVVLYLFCSSM